MPSSHPETFSRFMTAPLPAGSTARLQPPVPAIVVPSTVRFEPETKCTGYMAEDRTQSLRIVTLDARTVMEPEMFLPSITAPLLVTVMEPDGVRLEQLAPVLVASGKPHE